MKRKNLILCCMMLLVLALLASGCGTKTYSITGKVVEGTKDNPPMEGIVIIASGGTNSSATTDATGAYRFDRLKGEVTLTVQKSGWGFDPMTQVVKEAADNVNFTGYKGRIYTVSVKPEGKGAVTVYPLQSQYAEGDSVTLTATPEAGWVFSCWQGPIQSADNPLTISVEGNMEFTAVMAEKNAQIIFADRGLEKVVRAAINKPLGTITRSDIDKLDRLNASLNKITSLKGLESLSALKYLDLSITGITAFNEVAGLVNLRQLNLSKNEISDLSPLTRLNLLEDLNLNSNKITEIGNMTWLSETNFKILDIGNNQVTDLKPLKDLAALQKLTISKNGVQIIDPLIGLVQLKELDISDNVIEKLDALKYMKLLEKLNASSNKLTNVDILNWLKACKLTDLNLSNNQIVSVLKLTDITTLEKLNLANNQIASIDTLDKLTSLRELDLSGNQISDISKLSALKSVEKLYLHKNKISNIAPLLSMTGLKEVTLMDNQLMLSTGSDAYNTIKALRTRGVIVRYDYYENDAPWINPINPLTVNENQPLTFTIQAGDANNDVINYTATNNNNNATSKNIAQYFNPTTHVFSWTPTYDDAGIYMITFTVADKETSNSINVQITVNNTDRAPRFTTPPVDVSVKEAQELKFSVAAVDDDGDQVIYSATGPTGADQQVASHFDPVAREFKWTPGYDDSGVYTVIFSASDGQKQTDVPVKITVIHVNRAPYFTVKPVSPQTVNENQQLQFSITAADDDKEDTLTYSAAGDCVSFFDVSTHTFTWTPSYNDGGKTYKITLKATDGKDTVSHDVFITVNNVDRPAYFLTLPNGPQSVNEYANYSFKVAAADDDNDPIVYGFTSDVSALGATINAQTGDFSWTPDYRGVGVHTIVFTAKSNNTTVSSQPVTLTVNDLEFSPELTPIGNKDVNEGTSLSFTIKATDKDNDALTYRCDADQYADKFNPLTRTFSWTPTYDDGRQAPYNFTFVVTDTKGNSTSETIAITVHNVNRPPTLVVAGVPQLPINVTETGTVLFSLVGSDPDGEIVTYGVKDPNNKLAQYFDPVTHSFNWTTTYADAGSYSIVFTVTDGTLTTELTVPIIVANLDRAPRISPLLPQYDVDEYSTLAFKLDATDDDSDPITYSSVGLPMGASLDPKTGSFSWTPTYAAAGKSYPVTFNATANGKQVSTNTTINVKDLSFQPEFTGFVLTNNTITVNEGQTLNFKVTAIDKDNDPITYGALGGIASHFDPVSQNFSWTPDYSAAASSPYTITFTLDDGHTPQLQKTVTINVLNVDRQPTIDTPGAPANAPIGRLLSFSVIASDPDGDAVTLGTSGKLPNGASFDPVAGVFSWTPQANQVGNQTITFTATSNNVTVAKNVTILIQGPSLSVTTFAVQPDTFLPNQIPTFTLTVRNNGNIDTAVFDVKWEVYQNNVKIIDQEYHDTVNTLRVAQSASVTRNTWDFHNLPYGTYEMRVTIDEGGTQGGPATASKAFTIIKPQYKLNITCVGQGTIIREPNLTTYPVGTEVTLTALPSQGWKFDNWSGDVAGSVSKVKVTVNADTNITATFSNMHLPYKLAYISKKTYPNGEIWLMDQNCGQTVVNLDHSLIPGTPKWSPDGSKLIFDARNATGTRWDIYMVNAATITPGVPINPINLTGSFSTSINRSPGWAPDGTKIAYASNAAGASLEIYMMDVNLKVPSRITQNDGEDNDAPQFSPDGSQIISITTSGLIVKSPASPNSPTISINKDVRVNGVDISSASNPVWSPDGRKIAFESNGNIYVATFNARNGDPYFEWTFAQLTTSGGSKPTWCPSEVVNSQKLAFISNRVGGQNDLYTLSIGQDDSLAVRLTSTDSANESEFSWTNDGSTMAVVSDVTGNKELHILDVVTKNLTELTYQAGDDFAPAWSSAQ